MTQIPKSKEAEQIVLGSLLMAHGEEVAPKVVDEVKPSELYWKEHRILYKAIMDLWEQDRPVEITSVAGRLEDEGKLSEANGRSYLADLANKVVTTANLDHYIEIIKEKSTQRRLIKSGKEISQMARDGGDLSEILDSAEQKIFDITKEGGDSDYSIMSDSLSQHIERLEELHHSSEEVINGVPVGYSDLDYKLGGLKGGDLVVLAGRPGMGKTGLALSFARKMALDGYGVGFFSLEMTEEMINTRLLCGEARVNLHKAQNGNLNTKQFQKLASSANKFKDTTIAIEDTPHLPVIDVKTKARRMKAKDGVDIIMVDYLQLMQGSGKADTREQEVAKMTRSLKALAMELDIPVIALSQLNREAEYRSNKRPKLADLRESGAIEQDTNKVLFVYRESYYEDEETDQVDATEIIIAKQRNGPTGTVKLAFHPTYASFYELGPSR